MKYFAAFFLLTTYSSFITAQDKPRVFIQGKGSENIASAGSAGGDRHWGAWGSKSTVDAHDESMEVTKDLQKNCNSVVVTLNQANADYTLMLNRESKQNLGLLRTNSQVQVANRVGDILGTSATHTVGNAAKDACALITSDWASHSHSNAAASNPAPTVAPEMQSKVPVQPSVSASGAVQPAIVGSNSGSEAATVSADEAARREKQHQACLDLAKDNPAIVCK